MSRLCFPRPSDFETPVTGTRRGATEQRASTPIIASRSPLARPLARCGLARCRARPLIRVSLLLHERLCVVPLRGLLQHAEEHCFCPCEINFRHLRRGRRIGADIVRRHAAALAPAQRLRTSLPCIDGHVERPRHLHAKSVEIQGFVSSTSSRASPAAFKRRL